MLAFLTSHIYIQNENRIPSCEKNIFKLNTYECIMVVVSNNTDGGCSGK